MLEGGEGWGSKPALRTKKNKKKNEKRWKNENLKEVSSMDGVEDRFFLVLIEFNRYNTCIYVECNRKSKRKVQIIVGVNMDNSVGRRFPKLIHLVRYRDGFC